MIHYCRTNPRKREVAGKAPARHVPDHMSRDPCHVTPHIYTHRYYITPSQVPARLTTSVLLLVEPVPVIRYVTITDYVVSLAGGGCYACGLWADDAS